MTYEKLPPKASAGTSQGSSRGPRANTSRYAPQYERKNADSGGYGSTKEPLDICVLYGWHPVMEALRNPRRRFLRFLASENALRKIQEECTDAAGFTLPIEPELVHPREIDRLLTADAVHQGLYLEVKPLPPLKYDNLPKEALVLILDQITDPHNVGAMLRTAAAFGVCAVVTTARHSPAATGVLAKSASGALEHVPIIEVRNLSDAIEDLKARGFLCVGLDSDAEIALDASKLPVALRTPMALVMGAEGKGLRQRTRETCHYVARLEMPGTIKSLNVSNATALALYITNRALTPKE
jgi:23S rRNA (guanosine2251-2'-O)-methyltransferase